MSAAQPDHEAGPRRILGRASLVAAGTAWQQGVTLAAGLLIARVLGAAEYGIFNLARNLVDVTAILTRLGLDIGLQRRFGEARAAADHRVAQAVLRRLRLLAAGVALLPVIAVAAGLGDALEAHVYRYDRFGEVLLLLALALPFATDLSILGGAYRGKLRLAPSVLVESVLLPTLRLALIVVLFLAGWRLWAVVTGTVIATFVASAVLAVRAHRDFPADLHDSSWRDALHVTRYSTVLAGGVLVATLTSTLDLIVLGRHASAEALGQYALVKTLLLIMGVFGIAFAQGLGALVAERFRNGDIDGLVRVMSLTMRWIALATLPVFVVFVFWGAELVRLFGDSFAIAQPVVALLAVGQFLFSVLGANGWALSMTGRQLLELKTLALGLVSAVVACGLLVPRYGQLGAAMATCLSIGIAQFVRLVFVRRHLGRWPLGGDVFVIAAAGLLLGAVVDRLSAWLPLPGAWQETAAVGAFLLAWPALAWLLLDARERTGIRAALASLRLRPAARAGYAACGDGAAARGGRES